MDKTIEIVIIAMVAALLALRLVAVLGRRAEHDDPAPQPRFEPHGDTAPRGPPQGLPERRHTGTGARAPVPGVIPAIERGLKEIVAADRRFDLTQFVEGARGAYKMVLEAFWAGDKAALANLCDASVLKTFEDAIAAREAAGEKLENRLVRIDEIEIAAATFAAPVARIAVRFVADIAAVTRNAKGEVIAGSLHDAVVARDLWTFSRDVSSPAPDWLLDETDEA